MKKYLKVLVGVLVLVSLISGGKSVYEQYQAEKSAEEDIITVACVGDSLTFRRSYDGWPIYNYPDILSGLLGEQYKVTNYGMGGTCVQADMENPFIDTRAYGASVEAEADVLIIMLGTNDIWNARWRNEETFYQYYIALIDSYLETDNQPEIYLCTIPEVFMEDNTMLGKNFKEKTSNVSELVRQIALERGYHLIDIYEITGKHPEWYEEDGIHFNQAGADGVAETVYKAIK